MADGSIPQDALYYVPPSLSNPISCSDLRRIVEDSGMDAWWSCGIFTLLLQTFLQVSLGNSAALQVGTRG